jgi:hypothetical protein
MSGQPNYDRHFDPPDDNWGSCPHCGCSQEDAERLFSSEVYVCHCGAKYDDEAAHPTKDELFEDHTGDEP